MRLETLRARAMSVLKRDIAHMNIEVERGKLSGSASKNLIDYLKFLTSEIETRLGRKKTEDAALTKLTPNELRDRAKALLNEEESKP